MDNNERKYDVLIVDDDENICRLLELYLIRDGFNVQVCNDGESALNVINGRPFDVVVLDIMLPGIDGLTVLSELRKSSDVPVIMLSARGELSDRVSGLDKGADDYLTKPFEPQELIARLHAVLRRIKPEKPAKRITLFNLTVSISDFTVTLDGEKIDMPPKEIELLYTLVKTPMHVFTRDDLLKSIWGADYSGDPRTVDVHIKRVREKLGDNPHWKLTTVWGVGYKIELF